RVRPAVRRRCAESLRRPRFARGSEDTRRSISRGGPDPTGPGPRRGWPSAVLDLETNGMHRPRGRSPEGGTFPCPDCGLELEVTAVEPFHVDAAPREAEDWGE